MDASDRLLAFYVWWAMIGDTVKAVGLRISGYLVAGAVVAALLFYVFGKIDAWLGAHDGQITEQSRALVQQHAANVRWRAKLERAERALQISAAALHDHANALRLSVAPLPLEQQPRAILVQIARTDSTAYAKCAVALRSCQERASLAELESHRLAYQLGEQTKVRDRRCGIFVGYGVAAYNAPNATARLAWELGAGCRIVRIPFLP